MLRSADTLADILEAILPLDRACMLAALEGARRRAAARAEVLVLSKKEARQAWDEVERLGRLLYFVKFGKSAPNVSAYELSLYDYFLAERSARRDAAAAAPTKRRPARPRPPVTRVPDR